MWKDPFYDRVPGPELGYVRLPIYVDLTKEEYKKFNKKWKDAGFQGTRDIQCIQVVRSERSSKRYDITKPLDEHKANLLFRWLFKL